MNFTYFLPLKCSQEEFKIEYVADVIFSLDSPCLETWWHSGENHEFKTGTLGLEDNFKDHQGFEKGDSEVRLRKSNSGQRNVTHWRSSLGPS